MDEDTKDSHADVLGCQQMKPKKELLRVVKTPEGTIEVDPTGKRNGRGAYLCPQAECLRSAVKGKRLQRAFEQEISPDILAQLEGKMSGSAGKD